MFNNPKEKDPMEKILRSEKIYQLLEEVDGNLAEQVRKGGCRQCGGRLHRSDFNRKPRGGPMRVMERWENRDSFCCEREGCRKRHTPPSVRFLGRRIYVGIVVVLMAAMTHGLSARRVEKLRAELGMDVRSLKRWRQWWLERFIQFPFWKAARGRLMPPADEQTMPLSLVEIFQAREPEALLKLMKFLAPITTESWKGVMAM